MSDRFDALMAEVMAQADRFGHRQHVHLTWLAVRRHGTDAAITLVSDGIQRTARYAGAPQKYHATISRAWVELVSHHLAGDNDFPAFVDRCPALLDKRLLAGHYRSSTLASPAARSGWVEPDLAPLPGGAFPGAGSWCSMVGMTLSLPIDPEANKLLGSDPLALLIGMVLDQQIPLEKAFSSPYVLAQRLGHEPTAQEIADFDPDALIAIFAKPPALHRFPKAMAVRVQEVCRALVAEYDGEADGLWADAADGRELLRRIGSLPGFGKQKAQIFTALLGKQYGVQPPGWREAAGGYGEEGSYRSVADIVDGESLTKVRAYKKEMKAAARQQG